MLLLEGPALTRVYAEFKRVFELRGCGLTLLEFVASFVGAVSPAVARFSSPRWSP